MKRPTPKPNNIYLLKWREHSNDLSNPIELEKNFKFLCAYKKGGKLRYLFQDETGKKHSLSPSEFNDKYVKYQQGKPDQFSNVLNFVDITISGTPPKYYLGLQVKSKIYYMKDDVMCTTSASRDNVKIGDVYDGIVIGAHHALIDKYKSLL